MATLIELLHIVVCSLSLVNFSGRIPRFPLNWFNVFKCILCCDVASVHCNCRLFDHSMEGFKNWEFMTTHCWGEKAAGDWILEIYDSPSQLRSQKAPGTFSKQNTLPVTSAIPSRLKTPQGLTQRWFHKYISTFGLSGVPLLKLPQYQQLLRWLHFYRSGSVIEVSYLMCEISSWTKKFCQCWQLFINSNACRISKLDVTSISPVVRSHTNICHLTI